MLAVTLVLFRMVDYRRGGWCHRHMYTDDQAFCLSLCVSGCLRSILAKNVILVGISSLCYFWRIILLSIWCTVMGYVYVRVREREREREEVCVWGCAFDFKRSTFHFVLKVLISIYTKYSLSRSNSYILLEKLLRRILCVCLCVFW